MADVCEAAELLKLQEIPPCPICAYDGVLDAPHLECMQCTCTNCGWHYSLRPREPRHTERE